MTKKNYQKPTVKVVQLRYKANILIGSDTVPKTLSGSKGDTSEDDVYRELQ